MFGRVGLPSLLLLSAACSASKPAVTPSAGVTAALPTWLEGNWIAPDGGSEHWVLAGGALFGVAFPAKGPPYEVMIISTSTRARFTAWPGGGGGVGFDEILRGDFEIRFANFAHDFPKEVSYSRSGDSLNAYIGPGGGVRFAEFSYKLSPPSPAAALEEADRKFDGEVAGGGSAAWASWFDPEGAQWRPSRGRIVGREAIQALMKPVFEDAGLSLRWTPRASGFAAKGELGWTVGDYIATTKSGEKSSGGYVTIWRKQAGGSWKVLFDHGT